MTTATAEPQTQQLQTPPAAQLPAPVKPPPPPVPLGKHGVMLNSLESLWRFSQCVVTGGFAPKGMERPEAVMVAIQLGLELGLSPMAALQNIAVVNGRPTIYGDAALALVRDSGLLDDYEEWYEVDGKKLANSEGDPRTPSPKEVQNDNCTCYVRSKRKGAARAMVTGFSVADAKTPGGPRQPMLWGKEGPWSAYPARMLKWRARGFNLRDNFGDVLKGLRTSEEATDDPIRVEAEVRPPVGRTSLRRNGNGHMTPAQAEAIDASYTMPDGTEVGMNKTTPPAEAPTDEPGSDKDSSGQQFTDDSPPGPTVSEMDVADWVDDLNGRIAEAGRSVTILRLREEIDAANWVPDGYRVALREACDRRNQELAPPKAAQKAAAKRPDTKF